MFMLGLLSMVACAVAHPALEARPPIIDYAVPMGYYPDAPLLRSGMQVVIQPKGEKGIVPVLPPLDMPIAQEVVIDNEPKKDSDKPEKPEKPTPGKPEEPEKIKEEDPITVKVDVAKPPIIRVSWPSWPSWLPTLPFKLPEVPYISNIVSMISPSRAGPVRVIPYPGPIVLK